MRAVVVREFGPIEAASLAEVPVPVAEAGELLIAIHAAPVNYADLLVIAGRYQTRPQLPFIPGKGVAGTVAAVGDAVTRFRVGDPVFAWVEEGGYAEAVARTAVLSPARGDAVRRRRSVGAGLCYGVVRVT
jgi:NADPH2:quinone reductase